MEFLVWLFVLVAGLIAIAAFWRRNEHTSAEPRPIEPLPVRSNPIGPSGALNSYDEGLETSEGEDDDGYGAFVTRMWNAPGVDLGHVAAIRNRHWPVVLVSVVGVPGEAVYLNVITDGRRRTYAADGRHTWEIDGHRIDSTAFERIVEGVPPDVALRPDPFPSSVAAALAPENNRCPAKGRAFVIAYVDGRDDPSFLRVVSGVKPTGDDSFKAQCHFRWGRIRTFRLDRVRDVFDAETGETLDPAVLVETPKKPRTTRRSAAAGKSSTKRRQAKPKQ